MAFGGYDGNDVSDGTWIWADGWQRLKGSSPPKRAAHGMCYDAVLQRIVLHGGLYLGGQYADLWQWQGGRWLQLGGSYDNASLDHHKIVFDAERQQIVIFGGRNYRNQTSSNTQTVSGTQIISLSNDGPVARHS